MRLILRLASVLAGLASLSVAVRARAAPPNVEVLLDGRIGQSTAPYFTSAFPNTSGYGGSLTAGARLHVLEKWWFGVRAPLALMRIEQPAGALYAEAAWGNPELNAALEQPLLESDGWRMALGLALAVGAPLAEHDSAQLAGRALRLADALDGFSEPALFTPGVLPISPAGSLTLESSRWQLSASLRLPLLFRVSNADLPLESKARGFGLIPVATLEARLRVLRRLSLVCAARLTARAVAIVDDPAEPAQLLAVGGVDFQVAEHVSLAGLLQVPLGGSLGGSTVAGGLAFRGAF